MSNLPATPSLHTESIGMHYIQFIVRDFDAVYERMKEKGATSARLTDEQREALFREFLQWRSKRVRQ